MSFPDETVMAYVDGELDPRARAEVEAAMQSDPQFAKRVAQYRELRARIQSAYSPALAEPVPDRLLAVLRQAGTSKVVDLQGARAAMIEKRARAAPSARRWRYSASAAAGLLVAVGVGLFAWRQSQTLITRNADGSLVAHAALAKSLTNQLAGESEPSSAVAVGLSFVAKSGEYCRTFSIGSGESSVGLACHHQNRWDIRALAKSESGPAPDTQYRTASSSLPPAILGAVQAQIAGDPLDRSAEMSSRERGWSASAEK